MLRQPLSMKTAGVLVCLAIRAFGADASYFHDIRPILQRQCQGCHQPNLKSSNLDLTTYEGLTAGGKRGPAQGLIVKYLTGETKPQMPLGQPPLPAEQIELVRAWVAAGRKDDTPAEARETTAVNTPIVYTQPPVITAIAFSPDGKTLAVSGNREVLVHDVDGGGPPKRLAGFRTASCRWHFRRTDRCWRRAAVRRRASARSSCGMWRRGRCGGRWS